MAIEYPSLKVPDLKKLLQERGLAVSGNKAELISRLQEDDKKASTSTAAEDEIDWDEDEKITSAASASAAAPDPVPAPTNSKSQELKANLSTSKSTHPTITSEKNTAQEVVIATEKAPEPTPPKNSGTDFALGLGQSNTIVEAEKRAARAKRFGIMQSEEAIKMAERAKKFRLSPSKDQVVQSLDAALPERRPKRTRDQKDKPNSRPEKRHVNKESRNNNNSGLHKMKIAAILDDPVERAKAEARAKRFAQPVVT